MKYYNTLELNKNCNINDIKQQYKKLARKWHPDKNPNNKETAENKFKELSEAYEVLSDPEKRKVYDMHGDEGIKNMMQGNPGMSSTTFRNGNTTFTFSTNMGGQGFVNPDDLFRQFFGNHPFFNDSPFANRKMNSPTILCKISCTLEELYHGCKKDIVIPRKRFNKENGNTYVDKKNFNISIDEGTTHGSKITLENDGHCESPNHEMGNIEFVIIEEKHNCFKRDGINLHMDYDISLKDALIGFNENIKMIDSSYHAVIINNVIKPGYVKLIPNKGMKIGNSSGNLYIHFNIIFPDKLNSNQINLIKEVL